MKMKDRLVELINSYPCMSTAEDCFMESISDDLADYLIANGVVVLPCKVGDIVYLIGLDGTINEYSAVGFCQYPNGVFIDVRYAEKTYSIPIEQVYFSIEDAVRALKGEKE
jgi:hypothetical protein